MAKYEIYICKEETARAMNDSLKALIVSEGWKLLGPVQVTTCFNNELQEQKAIYLATLVKGN